MDLSTIAIAGSALSSIFTGYQQQNLSDYQAEVARKQGAVNAEMTRRETEYNALITEFESDAKVKLLERSLAYLKQSTELNVQDTLRTGARTLGAQKAAMGASGVMLDSGSTRDVVADTMTQNNFDVAVIRYNSAIQEQEITTATELEKARGKITTSMYRSLGAYKSAATELAGNMSGDYYDMLGDAYFTQGLTGAGKSVLGGVLANQRKTS